MKKMKKKISTSFGVLEYELSIIDKIVEHVFVPLMIWSLVIVLALSFPLVWLWFLNDQRKYDKVDDSYRNVYN